MTNIVDELVVIASTVDRLCREFPALSRTEVATAVVDAWHHGQPGRTVRDPDRAERSARTRLSVPA